MSKEKRAAGLPACDAQNVERMECPSLRPIDAQRRPEAQEIATIAGLVSAPGTLALGLDGNNKPKGFWALSRLGDCLESGWTFCVVPARWLVAIDADNAEHVTLAKRWAEYVRTLPGAWAVEVSSGGGPDRLHVWAYIPDPERRDAAVEYARRDAGRRDFVRIGDGGRMRPPYAPHKTWTAFAQPIGVTYSEFRGLLEEARKRETAESAPAPSVSAEQIQAGQTLRAAPESAPASNTAQQRPKSKKDGSGSEDLRRRIIDALGDCTHAERDCDCVKACDCTRTRDCDCAERTFDRIMAKDRKARAHLEEDWRGPRALFDLRWSKYAQEWDAGTRPPTLGTTDEAEAMVLGGCEAMERTPEHWKGSAGATDKAAFLAFLRLCWDAGSQAVEVSERQLCDEARIASPKTVRRALRRLASAEGRGFAYLERLPSRRRDANSRTIGWWKVRLNADVLDGFHNDPRNTHPKTPTLSNLFVPGVTMKSTLSDEAQAAFDPRCLGRNARWVVAHLDRVPSATGREIAEATGLSPATVCRILKKLGTVPGNRSKAQESRLAFVRREGGTLAAKVPGGWLTVRTSRERRLEVYADAFGAIETARKRALRFKKDRDAWEKWQADRKKRRQAWAEKQKQERFDAMVESEREHIEWIASLPPMEPDPAEQERWDHEAYAA